MQESTDIKSNIELSTAKTLLSVVVPAYNEEGVLPEFHKRISTVLETMSKEAEIIYVNDGSTDHTLAIM